jgi:hypothetical protein
MSSHKDKETKNVLTALYHSLGIDVQYLEDWFFKNAITWRSITAAMADRMPIDEIRAGIIGDDDNIYAKRIISYQV